MVVIPIRLGVWDHEVKAVLSSCRLLRLQMTANITYKKLRMFGSTWGAYLGVISDVAIAVYTCCTGAWWLRKFELRYGARYMIKNTDHEHVEYSTWWSGTSLHFLMKFCSYSQAILIALYYTGHVLQPVWLNIFAAKRTMNFRLFATSLERFKLVQVNIWLMICLQRTFSMLLSIGTFLADALAGQSCRRIQIFLKYVNPYQ